MKIEYFMGDKFKGVNPKNLIIPFKSSVYKVEYNYTTCRSNEKVGEKYFLYSGSPFQDINLSGRYIYQEALVMNITDIMLKNNIEKMKKEYIIKCSLERYIDSYNEMYPYRAISNIRNIKVTLVCEKEWEFLKGNLILDLKDCKIENPNDVIDINELPSLWQVYVSYTNNRGNKKKQTKYFLTKGVKDIFRSEYTDMLSIKTKDVDALYKKWFYCTESIASVLSKKNMVSNVDVLGTEFLGKAC